MADSSNPGSVATIAAHAIVGYAAAAATSKVLGTKITHGAALAAALVAMLVHHWLDKPLAQFITSLGFSY
jgi:hypothetical protein